MKRYFAGIVILFLLILNFSSFTVVKPSGDAAAADKPIADWTFMVYLDADNNLESAGVQDMNEMETAGSTEEVNILAQFDRIPDYDVTNGDWTDTKRFRIEKDEDPETINSPVLEELGEVNMGDAENLIDFVEWGARTYPAEHYLVVLWNHGGAFWGVCFDDSSDNGNGDFISMADLRYALLNLKAKLGENIDIVGFDACLMAEVAVQYTLRDVVDYGVASGFNEPGDGWPYEKILPVLVNNPDMIPQDLGKVIADKYVDSYTDKMEDPQDSLAITMTVFDIAVIQDSIERLNEFSMVLSTGARLHNAQIWAARDVTESYDAANLGPFDFTGYAMYDIIDFCDKIQNYAPLDTELINAATALREALFKFILYTRVDPYHPNAHGLTIYFPNTDAEVVNVPGRNEYDQRFGETDFAKDKYWDEFLFHYYDRQNAADTPPTAVIISPVNNATVLSNAFNLAVTGTAFDAQGKPKTELRIDDGEWTAVTEGAPTVTGTIAWSYEWKISALRGTHQITVRVTDSSGNSHQVTNQIKIEGPGNGSGTESEKFNIVIMIAVLIILLIFALLVVISRIRRLNKKIAKHK